RGRRLHVDAGMLQALDARLHQLAVVIEQRGLVERARLIGRRRHPIGAVLGEQLHPLAEAPLVEQPRFVDQEFFERRTIDAGNGRHAGPRVGASVMPPRAYSRAKPYIGRAPPSRGWRARAWR